MITVPVYELLLLPGVTFFFKKDMFPKGRITEENIGGLSKESSTYGRRQITY